MHALAMHQQQHLHRVLREYIYVEQVMVIAYFIEHFCVELFAA